MCDYSLHLVASRPAKVGDKLVSTNFTNSLNSRLRRSRRTDGGGMPASRYGGRFRERRL